MTNLALIGNPNCGKTTLFNALTGTRQHTGNWPGVTVDKKMGHYTFDDKRFDIVDLPGTYAIETSETGVSEDERVVRRFVLSSNKDSLLINIVDATNLQRGLYLTFQLLDLNRPMIVVLNMMDEVQKSGQKIDIQLLEKQLGCAVIPICASRQEGLDVLREKVAHGILHLELPQPEVAILSKTQTNFLDKLFRDLPQKSLLRSATRWQFFEWMLGAQNKTLKPSESKILHAYKAFLTKAYDGQMDVALASMRYSAIDRLCRNVILRPRQASKQLINRLDQIALGRITGIPIFLGVMYVMFLVAINFGSAFIDFFDLFFGTIFVDGTTHLLNKIHTPNWLTVILAQGLGGGIQTVATFIPVIGAMFLCLSFLEDSGYLARAAMVVDRGMRTLGLPGKAFVPMLVGFGCNVPAIMGTRTLENTRERLMSIMMIPYMSCGARLPVYALLVAIFFPLNGHNVVFGLYLGGVIVAVVTGLILKHTILPGKTSFFIMELPPYRLPTLRNLFCITWDRLKSFVLRAGKAIVLMVVLLSFVNSLGKDGSFGHEDTDQSILSSIAKTVTPFFAPMGLGEDNWPATVGIVTGIFAKEAVIGTLNALYSQMDKPKVVKEEEQPTFDLLAGIREAWQTIPTNLKDLFAFDQLPLISTIWAGQESIQSVAQDQAVEKGAMGKIREAFGMQNAVMAFLIFTLLYTPCVAALGAVYRETNAKWTVLVALWSFSLAWMLATLYYQISMIRTTPIVTLSWSLGILSAWIVAFVILRQWGKCMHSKLCC